MFDDEPGTLYAWNVWCRNPLVWIYVVGNITVHFAPKWFFDEVHICSNAKQARKEKFVNKIKFLVILNTWLHTQFIVSQKCMLIRRWKSHDINTEKAYLSKQAGRALLDQFWCNFVHISYKILYNAAT